MRRCTGTAYYDYDYNNNNHYYYDDYKYYDDDDDNDYSTPTSYHYSPTILLRSYRSPTATLPPCYYHGRSLGAPVSLRLCMGRGRRDRAMPRADRDAGRTKVLGCRRTAF